MRNFQILVFLSIILLGPSSLRADSGEGWLINMEGKCYLHYLREDLPNIASYRKFLKQGIQTVESFWGQAFSGEFDLYVHPDRASLNKAWQSSWNVPDFRSECWMVASGVAERMDLLSPAAWNKEACEHSYSDKEETQKLITHELFHVFHGQKNAIPDFSDTEGIDWFVEGLATYASGQYDEDRKKDVLKAIGEGKAPDSLDKFWKGNLRYGLCASLVQFIDQEYGRHKLKSMLNHSTRSEILQSLQTTEASLVKNWLNSLL